MHNSRLRESTKINNVDQIILVEDKNVRNSAADAFAADLQESGASIVRFKNTRISSESFYPHKTSERM